MFGRHVKHEAGSLFARHISRRRAYTLQSQKDTVQPETRAALFFQKRNHKILPKQLNIMLTLKQTPIALIGILLACGLTEGEPGAGKSIIALIIVALTVLYVLVCNCKNHLRDERKKTGLYR